MTGAGHFSSLPSSPLEVSFESSVTIRKGTRTEGDGVDEHAQTQTAACPSRPAYIDCLTFQNLPAPQHPPLCPFPLIILLLRLGV